MQQSFSSRQAVLAILAESCEEPQYKKLITALCNEHQIPLIRVDSNKKLGEWSGLCKIDKEGKPRKVCGCSVVVIKVRIRHYSFHVTTTHCTSAIFDANFINTLIFISGLRRRNASTRCCEGTSSLTKLNINNIQFDKKNGIKCTSFI